MRAMLCCLFLGLVGTSSGHYVGFAFFNQGAVQNQNPNKTNSSEKMGVSGAHEEINNVGSRPPSCEHKCYGCRPCDAIQVPSTRAHLGVQYTNYEPEGWMCKCGPTFYSP